MASRKKQSANANDLKQQEILQAVVIADSFNVRFAPVTHRKPRTLLPLVNTPLLDYTLEFLTSAGVEQIFVFCRAHADEIRSHINNSKWGHSGMVTVIISEDCLSVGDALREIDSRSLIASDFVLVNGDLVSNVQLKSVIEDHKQRRQKVKSSIMTMILNRAPPAHRTRCKEEEILIAVDKTERRVLQYQKIGAKKKFEFPVELFQAHENVQVRYDLLDSHISICSPLVPQLFTDNFDYQSRDDFIRGILENEEILGSTIHADILHEGYAARVSNLQMYDAVSKDVICRWSYPLVPDLSTASQDRYAYGRHNVYLDKDVTLARGCFVEENVAIGSGSSIGTGSVISHSVIGSNCKIGQNVHIENAYIWDGVTIEDNSKVNTSLLCDNSTVKNDVILEPGCILSYEVIVGPDVTLPKATILLSIQDAKELDEFESKDIIADPDLIGSGGVAAIYNQPTDSDAESLNSFIHDMWGLTVHSEDEVDDESSVASSDDEDRSLSPQLDDARMFYNEVLDTLDRAVHENITSDNIVLEINSLKHAYNIQIKELNVMVVKAVIEFPQRDQDNLRTPQLIALVLPFVKKMLPVLKNYIRSAESQLDCLMGLEEYCMTHTGTTPTLMKILHLIYNADIIAEDVILHWYKTVPNNESRAEHEEIRKQVAPFISWLEEAEEESDD